MPSGGQRTVQIVEVGPRDGLQNQPRLVSTAFKRELIARLAGAGIRRIEVASFVRASKVPQMADADELASSLREHDHYSRIGLVMNRKGLERALAAGCTEIGMVLIASETFSRRNQGMGIEESLAMWRDIAKSATAAGVGAHVTISAACGCPFEGDVAVDTVVELAVRAAEAEPTEIALADTIGAGVPGQVAELFGRVRQVVPEIRLRGHFHNTRNTGLANAFAALQEGASVLDASCGGLGGCPFAPAATGNVATEDLVYMLHRSGVSTGVALAQLLETGRWLEKQLGVTLPSALLRAGEFPNRPTAPQDNSRTNDTIEATAP